MLAASETVGDVGRESVSPLLGQCQFGDVLPILGQCQFGGLES